MTMTAFDPHQYALDCGWDFACIEATAERGLSDEDVKAIDQWAGVHGDEYDPPTDADAEVEAAAVQLALLAGEALVQWCKDKAKRETSNA